MIIESKCEKDTFELGKKIGREAAPGDVYSLWETWAWGKLFLQKEWQQALGFWNRSAVLLLRLSRFMKKQTAVLPF